jgi:hypothetical protein
MKTTVEISDALLEQVRKVAAEEETTVRALIEAGLRRLISERARDKAFKLRKASFKGRGLQADLAEGSWEQLRDRAYEGRGS